MRNTLAILLLTLLGTTSVFAADLVILRVIPNKIRYNQKEQAQAEIRLQNKGNVDQKGTLAVSEILDLDSKREVLKKEITLLAGKTQSVSVAWNVGNVMFGRALKAEFYQQNKLISMRQEFYSVATNWMRTMLIAGWEPWEPEDKDLKPFLAYGNHSMLFSWAASDFGGQVPDEDEWWSGQAGYNQSKKYLMNQMKDFKALGGTHTAYTNFAYCGWQGFEVARQHPEWVLRTETGAYHSYFPIYPMEIQYKAKRFGGHWNSLTTDLYWPEAVEYGAQDHVNSMKIFGQDGIFFDGFWAVYPGYSWDGQPSPHGQKPEELSARNMRLLSKIIREAYPNASFWANGMDPNKASYKTEEEFLKAGYGNNGGVPTCEAMFSDPANGALHEVQGAFLMSPNFAIHYYRTFYETCLQSRKSIVDRRWGPKKNEPMLAMGWIYNADPVAHLHMSKEDHIKSHDLWAQSNHLAAIMTATRLHPCFNNSAFRAFTQFMTRYSHFLWGDGIENIREPEGTLTFESNREVWWEECVYKRVSKDYTEYLVHLVNSPRSEAIEAKLLEDPPMVTDGELTINLTGSKADIKAWAMSPYDYGAAVREPVQVTLAPQVKGKKCSIKIPPFKFYALVVVRVHKVGKS